MRKIRLVIIIVVILTSILVGCTQKVDSLKKTEEDKLNVVTTIYPEYDFVRAIAGDKVNLTMLITPGASIHSFEFSPADIMKIKEADVFIYIGGESDAWVNEVLSSIDTSKMKVLRLMDYVNTVEEETVEGMQSENEGVLENADSEGEHEHDEHEYDEHIWTSPKNAITLINKISENLSSIDEANKDVYRINAEKYIQEIKKVDDEIAEIVKQAPLKKIVVADKFPFRYFVEEFGLEYSAAFGGCSDQTDASAATIAYLIDTVKQNNIKCVYYVELTNHNVADSISKQTGAKALLLHSCHNVTKAEFDAGVTYLSLIQQNAKNLREGLN